MAKGFMKSGMARRMSPMGQRLLPQKMPRPPSPSQIVSGIQQSPSRIAAGIRNTVPTKVKDNVGKGIIGALVIWIVFTALYCTICNDGPAHFNGLDGDADNDTGKKIWNRAYFTLTTISTVGYGDISPKSAASRSITMILMILVTLGMITTLF